MTSFLQKFRLAFATLLCLIFFSATPLLADSTMVDSGYYEFDTVDGNGRECRIKDWSVACNIADWLPDIVGVNPWVAFHPVPGLITPLEAIPYTAVRTISNQSTKLVGAAFTTLGYLNIAGYTQFGVPHYATSWIYKDIEIDDPSNNGAMIDVQISSTYEWEGGIAGTFNYEGRFTLSIEVEDITDASNPKGIGSFDLVNRDRSGDQGFTDVSAGAVSYDRNNDTAHFPIKLQRGNSYRIYFKAEAYGAPLVSGLESSVRAKLATLGVSISDNMNEEIKQSISDLSDQITTHDQEIKQQLLEVKSDLAEIKRLLITPQGRREGFPIK